MVAATTAARSIEMAPTDTRAQRIEAAASGYTVADIRPEVFAFACAMESALRLNDYKGGWQEESTDYLLGRVYMEVAELAEAVKKWELTPAAPCRRRLRGEAADVANFAMMLADVAGSLNVRKARETLRAALAVPTPECAPAEAPEPPGEVDTDGYPLVGRPTDRAQRIEAAAREALAAMITAQGGAPGHGYLTWHVTNLRAALAEAPEPVGEATDDYAAAQRVCPHQHRPDGSAALDLSLERTRCGTCENIAGAIAAERERIREVLRE